MAFLAVAEVRFAEGALIVVAGRAALGAAAREVLEGGGRGDLSGLRQPCPDDVAIRAAQALARAVCGVAKAVAEGASGCGRARVCADACVARPAG